MFGDLFSQKPAEALQDRSSGQREAFERASAEAAEMPEQTQAAEQDNRQGFNEASRAESPYPPTWNAEQIAAYERAAAEETAQQERGAERGPELGRGR